jgi:hypothetical protein
MEIKKIKGKEITGENLMANLMGDTVWVIDGESVSKIYGKINELIEVVNTLTKK